MHRQTEAKASPIHAIHETASRPRANLHRPRHMHAREGGWCASSRLGPITPRSPALPSPLDPAEATREPPPPLERPDATIAIRPCVPHQSPAKPSKAQPRRLVRLQTVPLASSHRRLDLLSRPPASLARQCRPRVNPPLDQLRGSTKPESTRATRGWLAGSSQCRTDIHPSLLHPISTSSQSSAAESHECRHGMSCRSCPALPASPPLNLCARRRCEYGRHDRYHALPCHAMHEIVRPMNGSCLKCPRLLQHVLEYEYPRPRDRLSLVHHLHAQQRARSARPVSQCSSQGHVERRES